ncbi:nucleotidyltransferase domain-containing protein [Butyrivibrio sp. MC2013]|uniref:nucleotidyltransferase domain-containing protein n=1 Tax=Butyrivibrio sp. MC2013 TaxID=1280686 RepID=UPI00040CD14F|nr:nucleotidyltransferase domain-containing protein [Butyrivibrio sp. MC2013]
MILRDSHKKMIDAVISKAGKDCPGVLDIIGVYGSALTGDVHEHSDLDLMIVINDDKGYCLADCFILEDEAVGYDIYCTGWHMLEEDALCRQANISKLMDSEIVYCRDDSVLERLESLRSKAAAILSSDERYEIARDIAEGIMKYSYTPGTGIGRLRMTAAEIIYSSMDAVMIWNGSYFRRGSKRVFEELEAIKLPEGYIELVHNIASAASSATIIESLDGLTRSLYSFIGIDGSDDALSVKECCAGEASSTCDKELPSASNISGSYEESFSNWRNKMPGAAERGDVYSSFMNLASLQFMLDDIASEVDIPSYDIMSAFDPGDLYHNVSVFDNALKDYRKVYDSIDLPVRSFADVDEFIGVYLEK